MKTDLKDTVYDFDLEPKLKLSIGNFYSHLELDMNLVGCKKDINNNISTSGIELGVCEFERGYKLTLTDIFALNIKSEIEFNIAAPDKLFKLIELTPQFSIKADTILKGLSFYTALQTDLIVKNEFQLNMDHAIGLKYSNNGFKFYLEEVFRWVNESIFMVVQTELLAGAYYGIKITDKAVLETGAEVTFEGADFSILIEPEIALKYKF